MSDFMDALIPPRKNDFTLVPLPENDLDGDNMVPNNYTFDTQLMVWVCELCGAAVSNTDLHTEWHDQLLGGLDRDDTPR